MECPQALYNIWLIIQSISWTTAFEGVANYIGDHNARCFFRGVVAFLLRDPATPQLPDGWKDWYNSGSL